MSEVRWNKFGELKMPNGMTLLFSGRQNANDIHRKSVDILLNQKMRKNLIEWCPVSKRIIIVTFKGTILNLSIIQYCAPIEQAEVWEKDCFYSQLQEAYNKVKKKNFKTVIGDLHVKVGNDRTGFEQVIGNHDLEGRNQNREMLLE